MASCICWRVYVVAKSPVDWISVKRHWPGHKCGFTKDCFGDCGCFRVGVGVGVRVGPVHVRCSNVVERVSY